LRAFKGGAVAIALSVEDGTPRLLLSTVLATCADGDPLSFEPYRVAVGMARDPQGKASTRAAAAVAEGRKRQDAFATKSLQEIIRHLEEAGYRPAIVALLVNRAGWITDLLDYSLGWPEHVPVAETLAVRDALRFAVTQGGLELAEMDEKSLSDLATATLGQPSIEIDACLKTLGTVAGTPWRKEQKLACLAAWVAATTRR
jgi:hypothetical protein